MDSEDYTNISEDNYESDNHSEDFSYLNFISDEESDPNENIEQETKVSDQLSGWADIKPFLSWQYIWQYKLNINADIITIDRI